MRPFLRRAKTPLSKSGVAGQLLSSSQAGVHLSAGLWSQIPPSPAGCLTGVAHAYSVSSDPLTDRLTIFHREVRLSQHQPIQPAVDLKTATYQRRPPQPTSLAYKPSRPDQYRGRKSILFGNQI